MILRFFFCVFRKIELLDINENGWEEKVGGGIKRYNFEYVKFEIFIRFLSGEFIYINLEFKRKNLVDV